MVCNKSTFPSTTKLIKGFSISLLIASLQFILLIPSSLPLMGDSRSPTKDSYSILGITKTATIKDMCKAYKSLVTKWNPDKNPSNKTEAEAKFKEINEAYKVLNERKLEDLLANEDHPTTTAGAHSHHKSVDDIGFFSPRSSFFSRTTSRRSQTPTPTRSYLSRCQSKSSSTTPRMQSTTKFPTAPTSPTPTTESSSASRSKSTSRRSASEIPSVLSRNASRRSSTPIIFSQSTAWRKPPPVEKTLECTLEDLCFGCVKRINITKDVIMDPGIIVKEHEVLKINIQPGWKKGTKITFEGKGDERPGNLPPDIIFSIDEERHPLFKRDGDDLELQLQIPLVKALTGCSLTVPLLGGENMNLSFDDILYPGYEKVIPGQGMPINTDEEKRGDLRVKFLVDFPMHLSQKQRSQAHAILRQCT